MVVPDPHAHVCSLCCGLAYSAGRIDDKFGAIAAPGVNATVTTFRVFGIRS